MSRLPPLLARDYRRQVIWPQILLSIALTILTAIIGGLVTASDMLGW